MQALDKLEHEMKVSECAELLRRVEPKQHAKRPNKYIFTIKVVEGEDLKACDPNGYSDPYVILCDEYQKRLLKTQVKYSTLNPHWNESFDITVSSPLNIIATIWDWDRVGDHDFVGRTSLKLDPVHFSDYLPREFWLDLDTQGRLLIRVSMEGERDDIEFYFGKAFRHLKRTERDMVRKITDKVSSHRDHLKSRGLANPYPAYYAYQCFFVAPSLEELGWWQPHGVCHEFVEETPVFHSSGYRSSRR
jgi:rubrerythrin